MDIFKSIHNGFSSKTHGYLDQFWRKIPKNLATYFIKNWFLKKVTKENRLVLIGDLYHGKPLCFADAVNYSVFSYKNIWVPMHQFEWKLPTVQGFLAFQTWIYLVKWPGWEVRGFGSHWFQKIFKFLHFCQKILFITSTIFLMLKLTYFCWNA